MPEINFTGRSVAFQDLVKEAQKRAKDGLTVQKKKEIVELALKDGIIDSSEAPFLQALESNTNISTLQSASFNPASFKMKVDNPYKFCKEDYSTPIKDTTVNDIGTKFDKEFFDPEIQLKTLVKDIFNDPKIKNSSILKASLFKFMILMKETDKEVMLYLKELVTNRKPPLSNADLKKIVDKLTNMITTTDYHRKAGDKKQLLISALHDIAAPSDISQRSIGTCAGTSIQIQMAIKKPYEYLDMLQTLARNKTYTTSTGANIPPNWTFTGEAAAGNKSNRTISSKIMQNSLMDYADSTQKVTDLHYQDDRVNGSRNYNSANKDGGLWSEEEVNGLKAIFGSDYTNYENDDYSPDQLLTILKNSKPSDANPVLINMVYDKSGKDGFHAVNVVGIDDKNVTIINPWGREETFPVSELKEKIYTVVAPVGNDTGISRKDGGQIRKEINATDDSWSVATCKQALLINDDKKRDAFLSSLTLEQKVSLIKDIRSGSVLTGSEKQAITRILENIFQGGAGQDNQVIYELKDKLTAAAGISLKDLIKEVKTNSELFYRVGTDIALTYIDMGEDDSKEFMKTVFDGSSKSFSEIKKLKSPEYDIPLAKIATHLDGDLMANDSEAGARLMVAMVRIYNTQNNSVTLTQVNAFMNEVRNDWDGDFLMKISLKTLGYNNGFPAANSEYSKFKSHSEYFAEKMVKIANY